ncbi:CHRD domain-containing protein [Nostocoides sp. F2B08]|uniref:CHRD domain-containing protein n=1 Tax=Nostocoides sp. F2B08 TaxID=2653936 RepID=UPI001263CAD7|nr:CHRD domain-containing protein [Tetrasphaera sp. F2B08]KAB7745165.1 CHRD domain-containing protein [Tetrasphaera sp. F2B08]
MRFARVLAAVALLLSVGGLSSPVFATTVYRASLDGGQEVPARETDARGQAILRLSSDGTELHYRVIANRIDNVVAAHIHVGAAGTNGPVVAFLFGPQAPGSGRTNGVLATGTITADDLVGPLAGQSLDALIDEIEAGGAYVNVHTNDGVDPANTGPGDFPGGEIRGQIG